MNGVTWVTIAFLICYMIIFWYFLHTKHNKLPIAKNCSIQEKNATVHTILHSLLHKPNYSKPYNLSKPHINDFSQFGEVPGLIDKYFKLKHNGFFLEVGAFTGEELSNTLQVERENNWTGLLVEAWPQNFKKLKNKNRRAMLLNVCLANVCGIVTMRMAGQERGAYISSQNKGMFVKCISVADALEAVGVLHVDWLILDTEGTELDILASFPWHTTSVDLIQIEVFTSGQKNAEKIQILSDFLNNKGFQQETMTKIDIIFRKVVLPT